jgi:hypothetical protein
MGLRRMDNVGIVVEGPRGDDRVLPRTPDGHSRLELSRFLAPQVVADHRNAPVNARGYPKSSAEILRAWWESPRSR